MGRIIRCLAFLCKVHDFLTIIYMKSFLFFQKQHKSRWKLKEIEEKEKSHDSIEIVKIGKQMDFTKCHIYEEIKMKEEKKQKYEYESSKEGWNIIEKDWDHFIPIDEEPIELY